MPAKSVYERFLWFHHEVKSEKYPNSRILAEKFELSQKTAQRDIEFMRDRLRAPLVYLADKRGYAYIRKNFGLLSQDVCIEVCLKFSPDIVPYVSEQIWHPEQKQRSDADGNLCLTFNVADFREVKREILKYGSGVEVLSPAALRDEVRREIEKMLKIY